MYRSLISVSDKTGLADLCSFLSSNDCQIISTSGTLSFIESVGFRVTDVSSITQFPETLDGRVKTLHPHIHAGILHTNSPTHMQELSTLNIDPIDLVVVNLYPFEQNLVKFNAGEISLLELIEKIDIGGPTLVRAAAKNYLYKTVLTSPEDYQEFITLNFDHEKLIKFNEKMAVKAFSTIARYDAVISSFFNSYFSHSNSKTFHFSGKTDLRYGENPHQSASFFGKLPYKQLQGKSLSYNNITDIDAALSVTSDFPDQEVTTVVKHANPCILSVGINSFENGFQFGDRQSAFGGIIGCNFEITDTIANEVAQGFYQAIIAPSFTQGALKILSGKKNLIVLESQPAKRQDRSYKFVEGGFLESDLDNPTEYIFENSHLSDDHSILAMKIVKQLHSNAIAIVHISDDSVSLMSYGTGQTSRIDAITQACEGMKKREDLDISPNSIIMVSDAFLPFEDNIEIAASYGIATIISPKGSIRDEKINAFASQKGIKLIRTNIRHFKH